MKAIKSLMITLAAVIVTWLIHEFAHWFTGEMLGNDMVMTLNTSYAKSGEYAQKWHGMVISAAGPLITITQAMVFYYLLKSKLHKSFFPFLLTCLYMRFVAGIINFINPNDEGRISQDLGLGTFTLSIVVVGFLFYLTYDTIKRASLSTKKVVVTTLLIMLFSSMIILGDQALKVIILN